MVAEIQMDDRTWNSFLCVRPPQKLLDEIMKKTLQFYGAANRLDPKEIYDMIPITFPSANVLDRDLFPGVGKFDVERALGENHPYFSLASWVQLCQKIAQQDLNNLGSIFAICEQMVPGA